MAGGLKSPLLPFLSEMDYRDCFTILKNIRTFGSVKQQAFLSLGSNSGNRQEMLGKALKEIRLRAGRIMQVSGIYETEPWGHTEQPLFLNQVIELETSIEAIPLLETLQGIEQTLGRLRGKERWQERNIDIDILFYGDSAFTVPGLEIPHQEIANRRFVLQPLCEIAPAFVHPRLGQSISVLLETCSDPLEVRLMGRQSLR
jgi:2-amino-4-hydroxy-6-hydroxymethyldihydropteridine diphosphokinase